MGLLQLAASVEALPSPNPVQPLASVYVVPHPCRPNEDTFCICPLWLNPVGSLSFFGVYDGHSGSDVSRFLAASLHHYVVACGSTAPDAATALSRAFRAADVALEDATLNCPSAGSTATVALVSSTDITVAHCGDSRALLCRGGKVIALTEDHRPARQDERERVLGSGGQILWNEGERVMGVLATTRAFGDRDLKQFGVTAEPEVAACPRSSDDEFLILATDGVFNVLSNDVVADVARRMVRRTQENGLPRAAAIRMAASAIGRYSRDRNSKDDITVVVVDLQPLAPPTPAAVVPMPAVAPRLPGLVPGPTWCPWTPAGPVEPLAASNTAPHAVAAPTTPEPPVEPLLMSASSVATYLEQHHGIESAIQQPAASQQQQQQEVAESVAAAAPHATVSAAAVVAALEPVGMAQGLMQVCCKGPIGGGSAVQAPDATAALSLSARASKSPREGFHHPAIGNAISAVTEVVCPPVGGNCGASQCVLPPMLLQGLGRHPQRPQQQTVQDHEQQQVVWQSAQGDVKRHATWDAGMPSPASAKCAVHPHSQTGEPVASPVLPATPGATALEHARSLVEDRCAVEADVLSARALTAASTSAGAPFPVSAGGAAEGPEPVVTLRLVTCPGAAKPVAASHPLHPWYSAPHPQHKKQAQVPPQQQLGVSAVCAPRLGHEHSPAVQPGRPAGLARPIQGGCEDLRNAAEAEPPVPGFGSMSVSASAATSSEGSNGGGNAGSNAGCLPSAAQAAHATSAAAVVRGTLADCGHLPATGGPRQVASWGAPADATMHVDPLYGQSPAVPSVALSMSASPGLFPAVGRGLGPPLIGELAAGLQRTRSMAAVMGGGVQDGLMPSG